MAVFLAVILGFRLAGHWRSSVTDDEARRRIADIHGPAYDHLGARAR